MAHIRLKNYGDIEKETRLVYGGSVGFKFPDMPNNNVKWLTAIKLKANKFKYVYVSSYINGGTASLEGFFLYINGSTTRLTKNYFASERGVSTYYTGSTSYELTPEAIEIMKYGGTIIINTKGSSIGASVCDFTTGSAKCGIWFSETKLTSPPQ